MVKGIREVDELCGYWTIARAVQESGYSLSRLHELASEGQVSAVRMAGRIFVRAASLQRYVRRQQALEDLVLQEREQEREQKGDGEGE